MTIPEALKSLAVLCQQEANLERNFGQIVDPGSAFERPRLPLSGGTKV
jgi:hypothetical protein